MPYNKLFLLIIVDVLWGKDHRGWFDRRPSAFDPSLPTSLPKGERRQLFPFSFREKVRDEGRAVSLVF